MQCVKINYFRGKIGGIVELPPSKSESNRALIIRALSGDNFNINNLSDAKDTSVLIEILYKIKNRKSFDDIEVLDVGAAGTVMRFLSAFLCLQKGKWLLTGDQRMQQRPIKVLVDGLNQIGAKISYVNKDGFPPIIIESQKINISNITVDSSISSQYISALLMIAPCLNKGLKINVEDGVVSLPYIIMTLKMLEYFGIINIYKRKSITIKHQLFKAKDITINYDWSAASYFYEVIAMSEIGSEIFLKGLKKDSLQGDEIVADIFIKFGVSTIIQDDGIRIIKNKQSIREFSFDFTHYPDIAQTMIVCCAALGIKGEFYGLKSLAIKETNRILALQKELVKLGCVVRIIDKGSILLSGNVNININPIIINTYNDHRMAMAFAPLALKMSVVFIENPKIVNKSYTKFWENIAKIGFELNENDI